jgi:tRNA pseudouridine38-40 synthase
VKTIRLDVAYDGTDFHGWQRQPGLRTVQGVLETGLAALLGEPVGLAGAGRTDAGVHARGQVASFRTDTTLPARAIGARLGRGLPRDVAVVDAREAADDFHARHSARARRYTYRLLDRPDVLWARFAWRPRRGFDPGRLSAACSVLEGRHDCAAFQASGAAIRGTECRVHRASWHRWESGWMLEIVADRFLYRMVRNIVGTALQVVGAADPAHAMRAALESRTRAHAGAPAPPQGLCLEQVFYAEEGA